MLADQNGGSPLTLLVGSWSPRVARTDDPASACLLASRRLRLVHILGDPERVLHNILHPGSVLSAPVRWDFLIHGGRTLAPLLFVVRSVLWEDCAAGEDAACGLRTGSLPCSLRPPPRIYAATHMLLVHGWATASSRTPVACIAVMASEPHAQAHARSSAYHRGAGIQKERDEGGGAGGMGDGREGPRTSSETPTQYLRTGHRSTHARCVALGGAPLLCVGVDGDHSERRRECCAGLEALMRAADRTLLACLVVGCIGIVRGPGDTARRGRCEGFLTRRLYAPARLSCSAHVGAGFTIRPRKPIFVGREARAETTLRWCGLRPLVFPNGFIRIVALNSILSHEQQCGSSHLV
ncbi:hypothetical protein DFH07DRAFT_941150 [Mycena maculata]|uniref:Uncharacterized protein n=1 Tax=Mycena maculata TaxID=230809 RepID=A0AAD7J0Z4_9AGAR|nr:hypothetical protein DFH07DRAFT_941150 [Mycena maculata]